MSTHNPSAATRRTRDAISLARRNRAVRIDEASNTVRVFTPPSPAPSPAPARFAPEPAASLEDRATLLDAHFRPPGESPGKRARDLAREVGTMPPGSPPRASAWAENPARAEMSARWLRDLQQYLGDFLPLFLASEEVVDGMLTREAMGVWAKAFTHETFDADFNYEEIEMIGDRLLEPAFVLYLIQRFGQTGKVTKQVLTEVKNKYMSKVYQARKSQFYGFDRFLRIPDTVLTNISTREDLYESFAGALFLTGEMLGARESGRASGIGFNLVRDFVRWDLDQEDIEIRTSQMNSITFITQALGQLGLMADPASAERWVPDPGVATGSGTMTLELPPDAVQRAFSLYGARLGRILARARGDTKTVARAAAYERARQVFEDQGMNYEFVQAVRKRALWERQDRALAERAIEKARRYGYHRVELDIQRSASRHGQVHAALYGYVDRGPLAPERRVILASANGPESEAPGRALAEFAGDAWPGPESDRWVWEPPGELPFESSDLAQ